MAFLEVKNLSKTFEDGNKVLKDISFSLEEGQVLSLIGSSGNGKTTLLRSLNGLVKPDSGSIVVNGVEVFPNGKLKKRAFGLVFQNFNLFPQYTALQNVTLAGDEQIKQEVKKLKVSFKEKRSILKQRLEENKAKCVQLLVDVGLGEKLNAYPTILSGGQQQRVAIARALAVSPDVLCFDEPTSALDPELTREVLGVIRKLRDEKRTMIIVTHEMNFARNVSDKVIFMANGIIEEEGTPEELFNNPQKEKTRAFLQAEDKYNE